MSLNNIRRLFDGCHTDVLDGINKPLLVRSNCNMYYAKIYETDEPDLFHMYWYHNMTTNCVYDEIVKRDKLSLISSMMIYALPHSSAVMNYIRTKVSSKHVPKWEDS